MDGIASCGARLSRFFARTAAAQPGHAPFSFAPLEIEDYERTLAPAGIAGATIVNPSLVPGASHPKVIANGNVATSFQTGAPIFLDRVQSAWEQYGGILGHSPPGGSVTADSNYNDLFPGWNFGFARWLPKRWRYSQLS